MFLWPRIRVSDRKARHPWIVFWSMGQTRSAGWVITQQFNSQWCFRFLCSIYLYLSRPLEQPWLNDDTQLTITVHSLHTPEWRPTSSLQPPDGFSLLDGTISITRTRFHRDCAVLQDQWKCSWFSPSATLVQSGAIAPLDCVGLGDGLDQSHRVCFCLSLFFFFAIESVSVFVNGPNPLLPPRFNGSEANWSRHDPWSVQSQRARGELLLYFHLGLGHWEIWHYQEIQVGPWVVSRGFYSDGDIAVF